MDILSYHAHSNNTMHSCSISAVNMVFYGHIIGLCTLCSISSYGFFKNKC